MFKSILVPVDLAHRSSWEHALPQAIELAESSGGTVRVLTVIGDLKATFGGVDFPFQYELMISEAEAKLRQIVYEYRAKTATLCEDVRCGSISREILHVAKQHAADLIVMASHRPELKDYLIGPNAAHVAQHAFCSVLVLRTLESQAK